MHGPEDRLFLTRTILVGVVMNVCSFKKLVKLLDRQLNLDEKLEVLDHLESCPICRDAVYQISRDRDEALFVRRPFNVEKNVA